MILFILEAELRSRDLSSSKEKVQESGKGQRGKYKAFRGAPQGIRKEALNARGQGILAKWTRGYLLFFYDTDDKEMRKDLVMNRDYEKAKNVRQSSSNLVADVLHVVKKQNAWVQ